MRSSSPRIICHWLLRHRTLTRGINKLVTFGWNTNNSPQFQSCIPHRLECNGKWEFHQRRFRCVAFNTDNLMRISIILFDEVNPHGWARCNIIFCWKMLCWFFLFLFLFHFLSFRLLFGFDALCGSFQTQRRHNKNNNSARTKPRFFPLISFILSTFYLFCFYFFYFVFFILLFIIIIFGWSWGEHRKFVDRYNFECSREIHRRTKRMSNQTTERELYGR